MATYVDEPHVLVVHPLEDGETEHDYEVTHPHECEPDESTLDDESGIVSAPYTCVLGYILDSVSLSEVLQFPADPNPDLYDRPVVGVGIHRIRAHLTATRDYFNDYDEDYRIEVLSDEATVNVTSEESSHE